MVGQSHRLLICFVLIVRSVADRARGSIVVPANGAVFIAKYCFDFDPYGNNTGKLEVPVSEAIKEHWAGEVLVELVSAKPSSGKLKFLLLDDQGDSYPESNNRWPGYDCNDKKLLHMAKSSQLIDLEPADKNFKRELHTYIVEKLRPRYWYVVALDCSGITRTIEYEYHLTNIQQGWLLELSMDTCGLRWLTFFIFVYVCEACAQVTAIFRQSTTVLRTKHPLRLLLTFGICASVWGTVAYGLKTFWHAYSGLESFWLYLGAKLFKAWSKFTLLLICVLMSKGSAISRDLENRDIMHGTIIIGPFLLLCLAFELWGEFDESRRYTTGFIYDTWAGKVLILIDMVLLGLYWSNLLRTYRREKDKEKRKFYRTWGLVYTSAFISLPVSAIVAAFVAAHVRVEVMFIFNNVVHSVLTSLLVIGLWPDNTQSAFCIDKSPELACTFGNQSFDLLDQTPKGDYKEFDMEDCSLAAGNG